jgi:hypothetical protein
MNIRCLLRGHSWGPIEGVAQYPVHTCTHCGKTKKLSSVPQPLDFPHERSFGKLRG